MTDKDDDIALDRLFAAARTDAAPPGAGFLARLQDDALAEMPTPKPVPASPRRGLQLWGALTGLATTAAAGVWIGMALPETFGPPVFEASDPATEVTAFLPGHGTWALDDEG